jgi:hypothetical protein
MTNLDNLMNIKSNNSIMSLSKTLLIFYVIIASQFTGGLLGKQLKDYIEQNRIAQHTIAFILLLVLINLIGGVDDMKKVILYGLIGYTWFIFTTKLDIQWNLIIIVLLIIGYLYESNFFSDEHILLKDQVLTLEEKDRLLTKNTQYRSYIVISILIITLLGTLFYEQKKGAQYGGGFSITKFLLF